MATKLLVKVPRTRDGVNLIYGPDKQVLYAEHIVELAAKKGLLSINAKKADHLKSIIEEIDVPDPTVKSIPNADLKKRLEELEKLDEKAGYEKRIAELEAKLLGKEVNNGNGNADAPPVNIAAAEKVTQIKAATTVAEIDAIVGTDDRASVIAAAEKRKGQL